MSSHLSRKTSLFFLVAIPYCLTWAVLCLCFQTNYRADSIEHLFISDQYVWGTGKHPTLSAWFLSLVRFVTGDAEIAPYLGSELLVLLILACIWRLSREFLRDERLALLVTLAAANYRYLNIGNLILNNSQFMTTCWVLAIMFFYYALTKNRRRDWALVGLWLGMGMQGKYPIIFLAVAMLVFMVVNRRGRRYWATSGPYLTLGFALLGILPHLIWLIQNDFVTFHYASTSPSIHKTGKPLAPFVNPLRYFFGLIIVLLPTFITLLPLTGLPGKWKLRPKLLQNPINRFRLVFLVIMIGVPLTFHLIVAATGRNQPSRYMMAPGMLIPLLYAFVLSLRTDLVALRRTAMLGFGILVATMLLWSGSLTWQARFGTNPHVSNFPGKKLAKIVEASWQEHYGERPCPFVSDIEAGQFWYSGNVHIYGTQKIPVHSSGITVQFSDEEMKRRGGIVLWEKNRFDFEDVLRRFPKAELLPDIVIPYERPFSSKFDPETIGMAILPLPDVETSSIVP